MVMGMNEMNKRIKNPMGKRLPRELTQSFGKYMVIFLFIFLTIAMVSGFLVADISLKTAYDKSFEKYNIEDGHFSSLVRIDDALIEKLENKEKIEVFENFYSDKETEDGDTIRIYKIRDKVNQAEILKGEFPSSISEIAIDRLYAENNDISVGNRIKIGDRTYKVSGFTALSDYSALFKNNADMMFDANKFGVALVIDQEFESFQLNDTNFCYAWTNNDSKLSESECSDKAEDIMNWLADNTVLTDFVKRADNQAIMFTGNDMGNDKAMIIAMLYIVIVVMAFIFAVTTSNTVEQEASVIGTLRASGYTKGELIRHYVALPIIVSMAAAVIGNVLGYTVMKQYFANLYCSNYSLTTYVTVWSAEAFLLTTIVPLVILIVVNVLVIMRKLRLSPIKFLRRDLSKGTKKKSIRLSTKMGFLSRFRMRVIFQNMPSYITLFVGILFANVILLFGLMMSPLLQHFKGEVLDNKISNYQYILKTPVSTSDNEAEKYCLTKLNDKASDEEITVYGVVSDSAYFDEMNIPNNKNEIIVSDGYMEKYGLSVGGTVTLREKYSGKEYNFKIADSYYYPASLAVFMNADKFRDVFDKDDGYFTGYFSDAEINDIDDVYVASVITDHDLTIIVDQLGNQAELVFPIFGGFAILLYLLMIYMLSKLVLEKNAKSISMVKILGYGSREINKLYLTATAWVVIISLLITLPISNYLMHLIYNMYMLDMNGWMAYYVEPVIYIEMFAIGIASYFTVNLLHYRNINRIPMEEALKNAE